MLASFSVGRDSSPSAWRSLVQIDTRDLVDKQGLATDGFSMNVGGEELTFEFEKMVTPRCGGVVHRLGHIATEPGGRARFTLPRILASDSAANLQSELGVAGAVSVGSKMYRIRPAGRGFHVAYESTQRSNSLSKFDVDAASMRFEREARLLEAQGLRFDMLEAIDPEAYSIGISGGLTRIDVGDNLLFGHLTFRSEQDFAALLEELGPLLPVFGEEQFVFADEWFSGDEKYFEFEQYIGDIPVVNARIRVFVNSESQRVSRVDSQVHQDMGYPNTPRTSESEAADIALAFLKTKRGFESFEPMFVDAMKMYIPASSEADYLSLTWSIRMSDGQAFPLVVVEAERGEILPSVSLEGGQVAECDTHDLRM